MDKETIIEEIQEYLENYTNFINLPEYDARNLYMTVKGLLDLYDKEKEKNEELKQEILQEKAKAEEYRIGWCNTGEELEQEKEKNKELINGQIDFWLDDKEIVERIKTNYISKDKIKTLKENFNKKQSSFMYRSK